METEQINADLEKKRGQLNRAQAKLDSKKRKNARRRATKEKVRLLIAKSREQIAELERTIEWHKEQIKGWETKLDGVPEEDDTTEELLKRDKVAKELDRMEALAVQIETTRKTLEDNPNSLVADSYRTALKRYIREFKSAKGHGF